MTTMYTIDTSTRSLEVGVAEVTKCDLGLIVRPAHQLGRLEDLVARATKEAPLRLDSPILLMGEGYQAQSSAGFVRTESWRMSWAVEWMVAGEYRRTHDARPHRPVLGGILPPSTVWADRNFGWADEAAASVLLQQDPEAVIVSEGQSNWARGYHLARIDEETRFSPEAIEAEWRTEVLDAMSVENYAAAIFRAHFRALKKRGVGGPLSMAREGLQEVAAELGNPELSQLVATRLSRGYFQATRMSTWEMAIIGAKANPEGNAVARGIRDVPFTLAQIARMDELVAEGRQEEANALWQQGASSLDLPIEEWERALLAA